MSSHNHLHILNKYFYFNGIWQIASSPKVDIVIKVMSY